MSIDGNVQPTDRVLVPPQPPLEPVLPSIPDWIPPLDTGQPNAGDLDDLSLLRKQTFAARNTIIPISYGRDRIFGQPIVVHVDESNGFLYVAYSFGQGEITGYETIYIDGEDKMALGTAYAGLKNRGFENGDKADWDQEVMQDGTVNSSVARTGTYGMNIPCDAVRQEQFSNRMPAPPEGTVMRIQEWVQRNSSPDVDSRIRMLESTTVGGALSSTSPDNYDVTETRLGDKDTAGWQLIDFTWTIPAGIAEYAISLETNVSGSTGSWDFDDISTQILAEDNSSTLTADAIEIIVYRGEPVQSIDSLLENVLTGYVDTLPNTSYIVLRVPVGSTSGFPRLEAILQGRRVYDPRLDDTQTTLIPAGSGDHRVDDPTTWVFSTNPAICFRDLIDNFTGWDILDQGVVDLADYNDELIGGVKRREIGLTLNKPTTVENWVKGFRTYMGAFLAWEGGSIRVITNRPQVIPDQVAMTIGVDDIVKGSLQLTRRSLRSVPNSVAIDYEDSSGDKWHTERVQADSPRVVSGDEARRLSRISLPGIHNASQAQREAIERLNWYLTDLEATLTLFDEGWQLQHGSIVEVTHPIGLDAKLFRVLRTTAKSGRWVIDLVEYDPAVYSNEVIANPTTPDTNLGNPLNPPTIQNLSLAEELFSYKNGLTGSRVRATWTATNYPFLSQYLVEGYVDGTRVWQQFTQANDVVTPSVEELVDDVEVTYEIRVYIQSPFAQGDVVTDTVQVQGKLAVPGNVPFINLSVITADQVDLAWGEAVDIDIWRYEVRIGDPTTNNTWALATPLELVDGLTYSSTGLAIGAHRFFVKARDSVGNESEFDVNADVTLSKPTAVLTVSGFEVASEVRLNWPAVVGGFVERYRVSYDTSPTPSAEITLDTVDTLRFQTKDVPEGTFEFSIWAQDKNGIEADTAATIVIEVTSDADAFLADSYNFGVSPSLTNVVSYSLRTDLRTFYVTNMGDAFAVSPTDFVAADPLANYHSVGASEWLSEIDQMRLKAN